MVPVGTVEGSLLTNREDIVQRWTEHLNHLLKRPSNIDWKAMEDASKTLPGRARQ